jgi:hypothetical protein
VCAVEVSCGDVLERLETELAILLPWLWFAHLQLGSSCSFHVCVRRCAALHGSSSQQFSSSPLYFIRQSAQCGICIAMEFQFYYPIPTTKSYSAQDLHTTPTNALTPHIRPAPTGLSVLTSTHKARIISAERHFRSRAGPPTTQIPHLNF